ncbi:MAG TPA: hypothetical protein VN026_02065 [Bacteroidia bacterium]|jgi:hypothetical protein|nr:hypothetical protein [Bacteroidia bacterium]
MKKIVYYIIGIIAVFNLFSCAPAYIPNAFNAPLMKDKNEVNVAGYAGTSGLDAQASASIIKHLAVMCDYSWTNRSRTGIDSTGYRKHDFFETGIGFYASPKEKKTCFEVWAGTGWGSSAAKADKRGLFNRKGDVVAGYYNRYFLQFDYGFRSKIVEVGFAIRGTYVNFTNLYNVTSDVSYRGLDNVYVEPAAFVRVGAPFLKFSFQVGGVIRTSAFSDINPKFTTQPFYLTVGAHLTLNRKWEDKK